MNSSTPFPKKENGFLMRSTGQQASVFNVPAVVDFEFGRSCIGQLNWKGSKTTPLIKDGFVQRDSPDFKSSTIPTESVNL
jgi:hypothetical protein